MHRTLSEASFLETPGRTHAQISTAALRATPCAPKRVAFAPKTPSVCIRRVFLFAFVSVIHFPPLFQFSSALETSSINEMKTKSPYHGVSSDEQKYSQLLFQNVPGFTRSKLKPEYALIAHESRVYGSLFGWTNTLGAYVVSPGMHKATILMTMLSMNTNAKPKNWTSSSMC